MSSLIAITRIKGPVNISSEIEETLYRMRLRKKFTCIVIKESPEMMGMLKKLNNVVAYGTITEQMLKDIIKQRAKPINKAKKIQAENIAKEFVESKTNKSFEDLGIKPFFTLHPPRGGLNMKEHFPKGDLGNHREKINELLKRML